MKYGLVYNKNAANLGDDIQTYAAMQFLPKVDYLIDRECMHAFVPNKREYVNVIASGWYLDNKYTFPFSPYINPLLISMHFNSRDLITTPGYGFLDGYTKKCLEPYFPLGCRDEGSLKVVKEFGYDAYFSGCMTLTIDRLEDNSKNKNEYICSVDLNEKCLKYLKENTTMEVRECTHFVDKTYDELPFDERMNRVKSQLLEYQNAYLVVTDRLHVALPCLALGTRVALIYYDYNADRIATFTNYLNTLTEEDFLTTDINVLLKFKNPDKHLELRKSLKEKCRDFIENPPKLDINKLPEIENYKNEIERVDHVSKLFMKELDILRKKNKELVDELIEKREELEKINNSKSWKLVRKAINIKNKIIH